MAGYWVTLVERNVHMSHLIDVPFRGDDLWAEERNVWEKVSSIANRVSCACDWKLFDVMNTKNRKCEPHLEICRIQLSINILGIQEGKLRVW